MTPSSFTISRDTLSPTDAILFFPFMAVCGAVFFVAGLLQVVADHIVEYSFAEDLQVLAGEDKFSGALHF